LEVEQRAIYNALMATEPPILDLPLSWARVDATAPRLRTLRLPLSRRTWVPCADIPEGWSFQQVFEAHLRPLPGGVILQGCNETLARYVRSQGGDAAQVGVEAALATDARAKASLMELAHRGRRWGEVKELFPDEVNRRKMAELWQATAHGSKPQLQCAFRTDFDEHLRGFVLVNGEGVWLGALTLSQMKPDYWHVELLLRREDAPVGVMEALILDVKARLRAEGARWLSLGTVPFVEMADPLAAGSCRWPWRPTCRGRAIARMGRWMRFSFDYQGLYRFKQKFGPIWRPLYLCGWPDLPWRILPDLSWTSRHLHLVGYAALQLGARRRRRGENGGK